MWWVQPKLWTCWGKSFWPVLLKPSKVCPPQVSTGSPSGGVASDAWGVDALTHSLTHSSGLAEGPAVASVLPCHRDRSLTQPETCLQPGAGRLIAG